MKRLKKILKWTGIVLAGLVAIGLIANAWFVWTTDRRLERQLTAIREAGEPLTLADLARKPIPPEQNAATYLRRAEADVTAMNKEVYATDWYKGWDLGQRLPPEGAKLIKAAFVAHPRVMPLLERAAACPDYDAPFDCTGPPEQFIERLSPWMQDSRQHARILHLRAFLLAAEGKSDEAARTALVLTRLARHWQPDVLIAGMLVRATVQGIAIDAANAALQAGPVSSDLRGAVDAELARLERLSAAGSRRAVLGERAYGVASFAQMPARNFWLFARGSWNRQESRYLDAMQMFLKLLDGPIGYRQAAQTLDNAFAGAEAPLVALLAPAIKAALVAVVQSQAMVRSLRVLNALQTHVPPESDRIPKLSELGLPVETTIDPFNGEPLHVKRLPQGWLVYSVGRDLHDDGGDLEHYNDVGVGPLRPAATSR
jgi:hypothetical protein